MPFHRSILCGLPKLVSFVTLTAVTYAQTPVARLMLPGQPFEYLKQQPGTPQEGSTAMGLRIVVLEGEDGVNIIKKKTAVKPVVEVRDRNNLPVGGAVVTFATPTHGAGALFLNGSRSITLVTDSTGRAAIVSMKPVGTGTFKFSVSASSHGQIATATIAQTNVLTAAAVAGGAAAGGAAAGTGAAAGGLSAGVIGAIVGGVAAVAVGVGVGIAHAHSGSAAVTPSATIGAPGTPGVAAPPH